MLTLTLYTTLGCHLCSQLEALLQTLCAKDYRLERVEISEEDALVERYGVRIPVLVADDGTELDRGFEVARLVGWLEARGWLDEAAWRRLESSLEGPEPGQARQAEIRNGRRYLG